MPAGATAKPANRFYVYLFLRHDGTPYYVGKGTGRRQWDPLRCTPLPPDPARNVRVLDGMSEEDALAWERLLIARYGRKDTGTGILRNLTDGGDGLAGYVFSQEQRNRRTEINNQRWSNPAARQALSEKNKQRFTDPKAVEKVRQSNRAAWSDPARIAEHKARMAAIATDPEHRARRSAAQVARWANPEKRRRHSERFKNRIFSEDHKEKIRQSIRALSPRHTWAAPDGQQFTGSAYEVSQLTNAPSRRSLTELATGKRPRSKQGWIYVCPADKEAP
jgi:hypothetical protein